MASTSVDISNLALSYLGGNPITSLEDDSKEANLCKANYQPTLEAVLETREWSFAIKRFSTATPLSPAPTYGFANAFQLDADVLRVLEVSDNKYDWQIEGRTVVTDEASIEYKAIVAVNAVLFSASFVQALASRLAAEIAIAITNSRTMQSQMLELYGVKLREAQASDGRQGTTRRVRGKRFTR